jgi:hypothetical protein
MGLKIKIKGCLREAQEKEEKDEKRIKQNPIPTAQAHALPII